MRMRTSCESFFERTKDARLWHTNRMKEVLNVARMIIEVEARSSDFSLVAVLSVLIGIIEDVSVVLA